MGKFLNGFCVGIGIGLFIAPQTGQETRRMIMERVAALRKDRLSEDGPHFPISTYPSQIATFSVQPAQPVTVSASESQEQVTPSVPPAQPIASLASEAEERVTPSVAPAQPIVAPASELEGQAAPPAQPIVAPASELEEQTAPPAQPIAPPISEAEEQGTIGVPPVDALSTPSNQSAPGDNRDTTDAAQIAGDPHLVLDTHPDQRTPTQTAEADTENTDKLPPLPSSTNTPSRSTKRKASPRTPNTGKTRGHSRS